MALIAILVLGLIQSARANPVIHDWVETAKVESTLAMAEGKPRGPHPEATILPAAPDTGSSFLLLGLALLSLATVATVVRLRKESC
jgi:hypothetical protein